MSDATLDSLVRFRRPFSLRGRDLAWWGVFGVADLACDLGADEMITEIAGDTFNCECVG
jgi:hypothetical protein